MDTLRQRLRKTTSGSITKRWFFGTFCVVAVIMLILVFTVGVSIKRSYYETAQIALESRAYSSSISTFFSGNSNDQNLFKQRAFEYIENYTEVSRMEVWVVDRNGDVIVSSSGFSVAAEEMPDYLLAKEKASSGIWTGKNQNGEKIMALTNLLYPNDGASGGAIRYIISLQDIDRQMVKVYLLLFLLFIFAEALVGVSGLFFIRSIVRPVKSINASAKAFAKGNFKEKIEFSGYNDELGELCDTFNYMADAIGDADRMKNDFISTVSHELRTPLTAIKGWAETISTDCDPDLLKRGVSVIIDETDRLKVMVEDLLDFSKIESGRMTLRKEFIDGVAELSEAVLSFEDRARRAGIKLLYDEPMFAAKLNADPIRIRQIFTNIIDNAIKYSRNGDTVSVEALIHDNSFVVIIKDTGCGIPAEFLPHIKEKFFKANMSAKGSGIGLAVCDEIATMHGGSIDITSEEGQGTSVTISLPISK